MMEQENRWKTNQEDHILSKTIYREEKMIKKYKELNLDVGLVMLWIKLIKNR